MGFLQSSLSALIRRDLPWSHGSANFSQPAGTQHGQVLKIAGQGVQRTGPDGRIVCGHHYVKVQVRLPIAVNAAEDAVFQQLLALQCLADDPA